MVILPLPEQFAQAVKKGIPGPFQPHCFTEGDLHPVFRPEPVRFHLERIRIDLPCPEPVRAAELDAARIDVREFPQFAEKRLIYSSNSTSVSAPSSMSSTM